MANTWNPKHRKALVCVHWDDAFASKATSAYTEENVPHKLEPMETFGLLLKQDAIGVSVACETYYNDEEKQHEYRGHTFIPAAMVVSVEVLLKPRQPRGRLIGGRHRLGQGSVPEYTPSSSSKLPLDG